MFDIIINALGLFATIFVGYLLKRVGLLTKEDGTRLSIIILNVTLPAAIISNLAALTIEKNLLILILAGVVLNLLVLTIVAFLTKKDTTVQRGFYLYSASGYNIGNFTLPFLQGTFPLAVPLLAMFDMGNSIMLAGGSNVFVDLVTQKNTTASPKAIGKKLLLSIPFTAYLIMLIIRSLQIDLPSGFLSMVAIMANANTFLSMFMIGLYLELSLPKQALHAVKKVLALRYLIGASLAVIIFFLPLDRLTTIVLCLLSFSPIPTFGVINSVKAGMDEETVGFASSVSFLISLFLMTVILVILGS